MLRDDTLFNFLVKRSASFKLSRYFYDILSVITKTSTSDLSQDLERRGIQRVIDHCAKLAQETSARKRKEKKLDKAASSAEQSMINIR